MKRIICLALIALLLCGCGQVNPDKVQSAAAPVDEMDIVPTIAPTIAQTEAPTIAPSEAPSASPQMSREALLTLLNSSHDGENQIIEYDEKSDTYIWSLTGDIGGGFVLAFNGNQSHIDSIAELETSMIKNCADFHRIISDFGYNSNARIVIKDDKYPGIDLIVAENGELIHNEIDNTESILNTAMPNATQSPEPTAAPKPTDTPKPAAEPTDTISITSGQRNALDRAKSYLRYSAFSYTGLIEQLEYEKFSHADAVYAVDNCGADWREQALKKALSYLDYSAFSYTGLIEQLEYEGFEHSDAEYAADNCGADWNEQAAKKAASYLKYSSFSRDGLIDQLMYEGFSREQAEYGVSKNGM